MTALSRLFLFLSLTICTFAQASNDWTGLFSWIDKYPSDRIGRGNSDLLGQPFIKASLKRILPKAEFVVLPKFAVEIPVRKVNDYLLINKCLPHNCPSDLAMLVIDVKNNRLWAGFFSREDGRVSTRWYGTSDDYSVLPIEIQKDFLSRHGD